MLEKVRAMQQQLTAWRRDFHMHPELGFQETRTSTRVAKSLEKMGYRVRRGVGRTGVVADFGQGQPFINGQSLQNGFEDTVTTSTTERYIVEVATVIVDGTIPTEGCR